MIKKEYVYKIGILGKPHGVHGELQMQFSDDIFDRTEATYLILDIEGILVPFFMKEYRFRSDTTVLMKFIDVNTKEAAQELTGVEVYFPRKAIHSENQDFNWVHLVGFSLLNANDKVIVGTIASINTSTANFLFEVDKPASDRLLIPANEELITEIDSEARTITVDIPDGLLDL